jgi:phenylalanyl-tRNA synthetase alpha chain
LLTCGLAVSKDRVGWAFGLGLERIAMILFNIADIRLFWSQDPRFLQQFEAGKVTKFKPFSKYPACWRDVSFWIGDKPFHLNDMCDIVRDVAGNVAEEIAEVSVKANGK